MSVKDDAVAQLNCGKTIAIANGNRIVTSTDRGISFLLKLVEDGDAVLKGAFVADKVVGRAAALLFVKGGVKEVCADVMSFPAEEILQKFNVVYEYKILTQGIVNRTGDGQCPMESAVLGVSDPDIAMSVLRKKSDELNGLSH